MASTSKSLSDEHRRVLVEESGILPELVEERGYRTVTKKIDLANAGFSRTQQIVPTLLIPIYNVHGEIANYQHRPDLPRVDGRGRVRKYETPGKSRMLLDVPRSVRRQLGDPKIPLFITEGAKKADSAASRDLCCIALLGVWNWRGTNAHDGKTALADWESIALDGRKVYIAFDSDVMEKREVRRALVRLKAFLEGRRAQVSMIYLPAGEGGAKAGLDDFFVAGGTVDELLRTARGELPESDDDHEEPFFEREGCLFRRKPDNDDYVDVLLTNFTATILRDVTEDDGAEEKRRFEIEAKVGSRTEKLRVPADRFASLSWVTSELGAQAIIEPGQGTRDYVRTAIQKLSEPETSHVYRHTGWRKVDGEWVYLHAGGALGAAGHVEGIEVQLPLPLQPARLPVPPTGDALRRDVRSMLDAFLHLGPAKTVFPVLGGVFRSVCGGADLSLFLVGPTGEFKSELAALAQSFMGSFDAKSLPISWSSTENAIEDLTFVAKDFPLVIDDFVARTPRERERLRAKAERVFRGVGNRQGRQRMNADGSMRPPRPPRCLAIATGEELPEGHSLRARCFVIQVGKDDIHPDQLTLAQQTAAEGVPARTMAAFLKQLAPNLEAEQKAMRQEVAELRKQLGASHRRTATAVADLAVGWARFVRFARAVRAIEEAEEVELWMRGFDAIVSAAEDQSDVQSAAEPTEIFLQLLASAVGTGLAHLAHVDHGREPGEPNRWGWEYVEVGTEAERQGGKGYFRERGAQIGWVGDSSTDPDIYLDLSATMAVLQRLGQGAGQPLPVPPGTLKHALSERGLLATVETERTGSGRTKRRFEIQKTLGGKRTRVLHFRASSLRLGTLPAGTGGATHSPSGAGGRVGNGGRVEPGDPSGASGASGAEVGHRNDLNNNNLESNYPLYPPVPPAEASPSEDCTPPFSDPPSGVDDNDDPEAEARRAYRDGSL